MANFHKHGYQCHGNVKEKSIKRRKHENQKIPLALSFSHGFIIKG